MSYVKPKDLAVRMIDAGAQKTFMATRDTLIRAFMGGAILGLAAAFAVTVTAQTGSALVGAMLFPVGFVLLYLMGFDLLTGVFTLVPLALLDRRRGVTVRSMLRNWGWVFLGNFAGAFTVAVLMAIYFTTGFATPPNEVGVALMEIGHGRTVGYAEYGGAGMLTLFVRAVLCNWMVSTGVAAAFMSDSLAGKAIAMWMPIMLFFYMGFEHSIVNMFLFPIALLMGGNFTVLDYLIWNEIPTVLGNLVGGLTFVGLTIYMTHRRTAPERGLVELPRVPAQTASR
ncbi:formate/nitrite transporter family protein [Bogoriella caseilytica]|uniref:Formate/nitrite transporter n=1 Tax=Bogoriella caseilytica TaxID=56055 RepID=A0A3N2BEH6_9MICO|nr:formate/nitrite transporter family protein [Bogoriella caseilytica]ROR73663.1 formate/nitrite transporter [Bogoriella caseilytica]